MQGGAVDLYKILKSHYPGQLGDLESVFRTVGGDQKIHNPLLSIGVPSYYHTLEDGICRGRF